MQMLFQFSQQHPQLSAPEALRNLVHTLQTQNNIAFVPKAVNPAMQSQMPRGPNMGGPPFGSPAVSHMGLSGLQGSPQQSSPHQANLVPPGMVQQGQMQPNVQGSNPTTSPLNSNKRRRASTVKIEGDEGNAGADANGAGGKGGKVKASPKAGGGKKQKGGG